MTDTINWAGASGKAYQYTIYPLRPLPNFIAKPGNYMFAKETKPGTWVPLYSGETEDLSSRFDDHHKMDLCVKNGATGIHVHVSSSDARVRRAEEQDIIAKWNPSCNG